jgi:hypothetical protein
LEQQVKFMLAGLKPSPKPERQEKSAQKQAQLSAPAETSTAGASMLAITAH